MSIVLPALTFKASPNVSSRHGEKVHLLVAHRPVGSYEGAVNYLCTTAAQASAHIVLKGDGLEATQLVGWDEKAWACVAFNAFSENFEIADELWLPAAKDSHGLKVAARIFAFRCKKRGIPPIWTKDPLRVAGICRHYDLGIAGGGHTDPTTDEALWKHFITLVKTEFDRGGFRPTWGRD